MITSSGKPVYTHLPGASRRKEVRSCRSSGVRSYRRNAPKSTFNIKERQTIAKDLGYPG
jgi:hypothetical protein